MQEATFHLTGCTIFTGSFVQLYILLTQFLCHRLANASKDIEPCLSGYCKCSVFVFSLCLHFLTWHLTLSHQVFGNKDTDGFYRAEIRDRVGLIPCNMVSEIQTEDDEMMDQLLKQGFLPLNTPVEKLGENSSPPLFALLYFLLTNLILCSSALYWLFSFPLLPVVFIFVLSCQVNFDRFKDGRSINRRSRKSKRGLCLLRCSTSLFFTPVYFHHIWLFLLTVKCFYFILLHLFWLSLSSP